MTRKTKVKDGAAAGTVDKPAKDAKRVWGGFHTYSLSEDEKNHFRGWVVENADALWAEVDEAVLAGLKFSLAADAKNDCIVASLTGAGRSAYQDTDICLTGRGTDCDTAIAVLVYKFVVALDRDLSSFYNNVTKRFGAEI